jgi:4-aminobutyrate aminotransferase
MSTASKHVGGGPAAPVAREYPRIVTPPPGPKARAIVERQNRWASTSYPKEYPLVIARGERAMVEDVDGNRYLDFMAGIAVASTGYGHPQVVRAIQEAAARFLHICGSDFYYESFAALCERLATLAPGPSKKRVFLTNSGTEAVEGAIKLARQSTGRTGLVAFVGAFHGRTMGALSLTASKSTQRAGFAPFLPEVYHVPYGYRYRCDFCRGEPACTMRCVSSIEDDLFAKRLDPASVAAIVVEPIQGEGGYVVPPPGYLRALRELCDRHGILLVCDEVQSGIGRTGKMFACEHEGVEPDVLLAAKGLGSGMPIGAIIAREAIMKWPPGAHGSTFGGNPVCCAAALATLDVVQRELLPRVPALGERVLAGVRRLAERHAVIGDVRGRGLMIGVEFVTDRATRAPAPAIPRGLVQQAFQKGLLLLSAGQSALRLAPPLVVDEYDVDAALAIIDACLGEPR